MMRRAIGLCLAALAATGLAAKAQTQFEMDQQAGHAYIAADAELNRVYGQLMDKASTKGKAALRDAQRAWVTFRDLDCAYETLGSQGGSVHPMVEAECARRLTVARTLDLRRQLDCPEGDVGCGAQ